MEKVKIKNNLRKYRKSRGITQAKLADAVDVSRTTVGNIDRCQSSPGYKQNYGVLLSPFLFIGTRLKRESKWIYSQIYAKGHLNFRV